MERLGRGELPVHEPGLAEVFAEARDRMRFATDPAALAECPLVIVSRDVPTDAANGSDTSAVLRLLDAAIPHLRPGAVLALMSQVPPGFTRDLGARIEARRPGLGIRLYYWVETLIFGSAVTRFLEPERIIVGAADPALPLPVELAEGLARFGCPILPMRYESAELTKTAINLYLFGAVTYANTLADLCEEVGADWSEMVPALRLDRRIGPAAYIRPSLGVAGGNLERDLVTLRALCATHGVDAAYIETLIQYNGRRYRWVHRQLERRVLAEARPPVIAVWGLAYKKDTRSTKNSMALRVIGDLRGRAEIRAYDPLVGESEVAGAATAIAILIFAAGLLVVSGQHEVASPSPLPSASAGPSGPASIGPSIGTPSKLGEHSGTHVGLATTGSGAIVAATLGEVDVSGVRSCAAGVLGLVSGEGVTWADASAQVLSLASTSSDLGPIGLGTSADCTQTLSILPDGTGGFSARPVDQGRLNSEPAFFATSPTDSTLVAAWQTDALKGGFVFWSTDGGRTWQGQTAARPLGWDEAGRFWSIAEGNPGGPLELVSSQGPTPHPPQSTQLRSSAIGSSSPARRQQCSPSR